MHSQAVYSAIANVEGRTGLGGLVEGKILISREGRGVGHARHKQSESEVVAAVYWKILDVLFVEGVRLMSPLRFHDRGFYAYLHDFLSRRYFHVDVKDDSLAHADNDVSQDFRLEPGDFCGQAINGGRETRKLVLPVPVGHGRSPQALFRI